MADQQQQQGQQQQGQQQGQMQYPKNNNKSDLYNMKYEIANELGVPLKQGYNGDLTSKQSGYVGGYMVKRMIEQVERQMSGQQQQ